MISIVKNSINSRSEKILFLPDPGMPERMGIIIPEHVSEEVKVSLKDELKEVIVREEDCQIRSGRGDIDLSNLPDGIYSVNVESKFTGDRWRKKIIKY